MSNDTTSARLRASLTDAAETHRVLTELRAEGVSKDALYEALGTLRASGLTEEEEDVLLEGMDFLTGFTGPDAQID